MYTTTEQFRFELGAFFQVWLAVEFTVYFAIGKFLGIPHEEAHLITAGLPFNRRASLLRSLVARSEHKNKPKIINALDTIQNESLRNIFSHSYLLSDEQKLTFIERIPHGKFRAKNIVIERNQFHDHVPKRRRPPVGAPAGLRGAPWKTDRRVARVALRAPPAPLT